MRLPYISDGVIPRQLLVKLMVALRDEVVGPDKEPIVLMEIIHRKLGSLTKADADTFVSAFQDNNLSIRNVFKEFAPGYSQET